MTPDLLGGRAVRRMARLVKWGSPVVLLVEGALVVSGRLGLGRAVVIAVAVEAVLALLMGATVLLGVQDYRRERTAGGDTSSALRHALRQVLPAPVAAVLWHELGIATAVVRTLRGRAEVAPGETPLAYGRDQLAFIVVMCGVSVGEILVFGLLVPWEWLRVVALVVGVYGMFWVLGFYCAMRTRPHVVGRGRVELRCAHLSSVRVPLEAIELVRESLTSTSTRNLHLDAEVLTVTLSGTTTMELVLRDGTRLDVKGSVEPVSLVRFSCDDQESARAVLRGAIPGPARRGPA